MYLSEQLSERIHSVTRGQLSDAAVNATQVAFVDTVGVTLAGVNEPVVQKLTSAPGFADSVGTAVVQGTALRLSALDAVLLNGVAGHALDFDDISNTLGGHPSVMLTPVIQAIGDLRPVTGSDAVLAYVVGNETIMQIAHGVQPLHYEKGWHPTVTLGIFGTVAAAARLLELTPAQTASALAHAVSLACGVKANFGSMVKPLHVGHALRSGLFAVLAAKHGVTARLDAFEAKQGFLDVFNGSGNYDISKIQQGWGQPFDLVDPGVGIKQFPCCGSTHAAIICALSLHEQRQLHLDDVAAIVIRTNPRRIPHTDIPVPTTLTQAKFSHQYVVARALLDGAIKISDFEGKRPFEPAVTALMKKITLTEHPEMPADGENQFAAEVSVTTTDGVIRSHRQDHMVGRGKENPMSENELWAKYSDCARRSLPEDRVKGSFDLLSTLPALDDISVINKLLCVETGRRSDRLRSP